MKPAPWIVVGTDFSEAAAQALEQGVSLAAKLGASVACVHAYEDAPSTTLGDQRPTELCERLADAAAASSAREKGVRVETFARRGPAWEKLQNVAFDLDAPVIVVGAHGLGQRGGGPFLGTVAMRLASRATRMVLIVPSDGKFFSAFGADTDDDSPGTLI